MSLMSLMSSGPEPSAVPASSKLEAVSRISALTGSPPQTLGPGSKERKSVLVDLAAGLALAVDPTDDKPTLAAAIARALGADWGPDCWSAGQTITLVGLNRLLLAAHAQVARRAADQSRELGAAGRPAAADGSSPWLAARSKLEAVSRISALTGSPPQTLGPGSKERKSVLVDLAAGLALGLAVDQRAPKPELGRQIADALGADWGPDCWSAGQTITLVGLNVLLRAATGELERRGGLGENRMFATADREAAALLGAVAAALPAHLVGRSCVLEMLGAEDRNWAQDEWAGFYVEFLGLPALVNGFGGGPVRFGPTVFDYSLGQTWDLKTHSVGAGHLVVLNDAGAVEQCLEAGGLGFLVVSGSATYDEGEFRSWQRELRLSQGKVPAPRAGPAAYSRRSKASFTPELLEAVYLPDRASLDRAVGAGVVRVVRQGRQASGAPRKAKFGLDLRRARAAGLVVATVALPG